MTNAMNGRNFQIEHNLPREIDNNSPMHLGAAHCDALLLASSGGNAEIPQSHRSLLRESSLAAYAHRAINAVYAMPDNNQYLRRSVYYDQ